MVMKAVIGETGQGVCGAVALVANTAVMFDTGGLIVATGVGDHPVGWICDAFAVGAEVTFYRWGRANEYYIATTGTILQGSYLKCGAAGVLVNEASVTTLTAATVGQARSGSSADPGFTDVAAW